MADKMVIVESKAKARTISRYLGDAYDVKACMGHVRDLPPKKFGVDVEEGFEPTYQVLPGSRRTVGQLRKAAQKAEDVYLAPDPDREGEAIAWHLMHVLKVPDERVKRVTFNEITRQAITEAFEHPRDIDDNLVDAQQARRILDRIVGYELSPLISRTVVRGLSAGRVQSVALRLVVERERERQAFEPEEYWEIAAQLARAAGGPSFTAELSQWDGEEPSIPSEEAAQEIVSRLEGEAFTVASLEERTTKSRVYPPFITSTMQRSANTRLRFSADRTMRVAQGLYEGVDIGSETVGLITYMRTDSTRVAKQALGACRGFIAGEHGDKYLPKKPNFFRSPRGAQAAHEAIRPTDVRRTPEEMKRYLGRDQYRLYELIWRRFVASQMVPARYKVRTADIEAGPAVFRAKGRRMVFDGNLRVLRPDKEVEEQTLPDLDEGEELELKELVPSQHFTEPPSRYTEASLVRELEKRGIGRPSTYAPTISTLLKRNYVRRERRALNPTDLGMVVCDLLVEYFPREMDVSFTRKLEEELDEVEEGRREWRSVLEDFYQEFSRDLERAKEGMTLPEQEELEVECEKCGKPMEIKFSRRGDRFLGCSGFPECKNTMSLPREGEEPEETEFECPKCGAPLLLRTGRRGREYLACSAFPECRNIMGLDNEGQPVELKPRTNTRLKCPRCGQRMYLEEGTEELRCGGCRNKLPLLSVQDALEATELPSPEELPPCPDCGKPMEIRRSRRGMFLGCSAYPDCKGTESLPKGDMPDPQPTVEECEKCGRPLLVRWGKYGRFLACSGFPRCRNTWRLPSKPKECPQEDCAGSLIRKVDPDGKPYFGCTRYPDCEYTEPAPEPKEEDKD
ncbi:MAG: type I DNA topoisomerase [Candidatus Brocadiia bacterium]